MPRTRSLAWAELKIGLVSVFAIVMATWLIFLLSGESGFWWQRYVIKTVFPNVAGLKPGAPVRVAGVEVGSVADVTFVGDRVEVLMEVGKDHASRITTTSVASLGSVSLLGESAVDITAASNGTPVPEYGYVKSGPTASSIPSRRSIDAGKRCQLSQRRRYSGLRTASRKCGNAGLGRTRKRGSLLSRDTSSHSSIFENWCLPMIARRRPSTFVSVWRW